MVRLQSRPALVIIDMQNGFCNAKGTFAKTGVSVSAHREIIPAINKLRSICSARKIPILQTRTGFAADYSDSGLLFDSPLCGPLKKMKGFIRGTWDTDIVDELKPSEEGEEVIVEKIRNSAFLGTNFEELLKKRGINHLILTGVATNVCVECTARDAWQHDYHVVTVADATATFFEDQHAAALKNLAWFGGVATVKEIQEALSPRDGENAFNVSN